MNTEPRNVPAFPQRDWSREEEERRSLYERAAPMVEHYWQVIRNNKLLIAGILTASLAIGLAVTLLTTPQYEATTRIEISRVEANVADVEGVSPEGALRDAQYFETQYELLRSRSLAERVVRENDLLNDEAFRAAFDLEDVENLTIRAAASILLAHVEINPVDMSTLVDIRFKSSSAELSARIANAWAEQFIAANLDRRFGATVEAREFLEGRLLELRQRLEDAERALIGYSADRDLFTIETPQGDDSGDTASQTLVATELQALNAALVEATTDRIAAESAAQSGGQAATSEAQAALQPLRQQRAQLVAERARLQATAGDEYPTVKALTAQIAELDRQIGREEARTRTGAGAELQARYREALSREQNLRARVNELRERFLGQRRDSVQANILQREVDTNRSLYNSILQRYREIGVAGVGENNISIVDEAQPPAVPVEPNLPLNLLLSLLIGAAIAGGIIFLREQLDQSIRDPANVAEQLGVPLLGSIPRVDGDLNEALLARHSELYEAYFSLFTNLGFVTDQGFPRCLMLTSSRPEEGKTHSCLALAQILSNQERRVLLVDADMRHSGISRYLELGEQQGLSSYLSGNDQWRTMFKQSGSFGFDVLPAGRTPPNAAELLAGDRLAQLLGELKGLYDHVIIDAPPVLGLADAPLIASDADGVLMIMEANKGKVRMISQSLNRLENANANIFGAVVTKLDQRNLTYGYGYGYGYGYAYGHEPKPAASAG